MHEKAKGPDASTVTAVRAERGDVPDARRAAGSTAAGGGDSGARRDAGACGGRGAERDPGRGAEHAPAGATAPGGVRAVASAAFPTLFGEFTLLGFEDAAAGTEFTAVVRGEVRGATDCPVRVHSECHTGDIFGSLRCDCREQLEASLRYIASHDQGAVIYLRQEGRGIGLLNKIRAYQLQDQGLDTVAANEALGFPADARDYRAAARVIEILGIASVRLLTNNPAKIAGLEREGITVTGRIPVIAQSNPVNRNYLATKRSRFDHLL